MHRKGLSVIFLQQREERVNGCKSCRGFLLGYSSLKAGPLLHFKHCCLISCLIVMQLETLFLFQGKQKKKRSLRKVLAPKGILSRSTYLLPQSSAMEEYPPQGAEARVTNERRQQGTQSCGGGFPWAHPADLGGLWLRASAASWARKGN